MKEAEKAGVEGKEKTRTEMSKEGNKRRERPVVIPYVKGIYLSRSGVFKRYVPLYFKPTNTLRQLLVCPKDKVENEKVVGQSISHSLW